MMISSSFVWLDFGSGIKFILFCHSANISDKRKSEGNKWWR